MMSRCPYANECWRLSYSKYYRETGNDDCPPRGVLNFEGFASDKMVESQKSGVYCENFPTKSGDNHCPELCGQSYANCYEYNKHKARLEKWSRERKKKNDAFRARYGRKPISKDVRTQIASRYKWRCVYCCDHITKFKARGAKPVIDHKIPLKKGGVDDTSNYVYACSQCNNSKQDKLWEFGCRKGYYDTSINR